MTGSENDSELTGKFVQSFTNAMSRSANFNEIPDPIKQMFRDEETNRNSL